MTVADADEETPYVAWKLRVKEGRQWWVTVNVENEDQAAGVQNNIDRHWLTKPACDPNASYENTSPLFGTVTDSLRNAIQFFSSLQTEDGHWAGDYGGPLFLLPGFVVTCYVTGVTFPDPFCKEIVRYLRNTQNEDGGWGLHIEGPSIMFGTCLNYISMRLMGVGKDDPQSVKARQWIHDNGGAIGSPQWGKLYMCVLNIMEWEGMDPVPPELWLLPTWFPLVQPGKWWCHCRVVYLAMGYLYGRKKRAKLDPLLLSLREELYCEMYEKVNWTKYRSYICPLDIYKPLNPIYKVMSWALALYEKFVHLPPFSWIRESALDKCIEHIKHEDISTNHICIGPVNKVLNMMSVFFAEGNSPHFNKHIDRCYDYLWKSNLGVHFQGYNGSQFWDTAFATKAIITSGMADEVQDTIRKSLKFIRFSQVKEDVDQYDKFYRNISKGGWPFSTRDHGWPITDCSADGLNVSLLMNQCRFIKADELLPEQNAYDAVNVILSMWNKGSGGWATYERTRTKSIIELINPAALFGDIMIDYPHVECTSSCVQALAAFREKYPNHRTKEVNVAITRGAQFLKSVQRKEGGWYGFWAVCFCYGTWFAICGLLEAGVDKRDPTILRACQYLVERQKEDGGWGESYLSCVKHEYIQAKRSQVVNTAWALLALMTAGYEDKSVIGRGIELLRKRQMLNGDFPQENISGVFSMNCMITYSNYRNIFPIWALGYYVNIYSKRQ